MSNQMDQAIQSVIDLHVLIENVFTGQNAEQSLTPLLNSFDQNFKMVTVQGQSIGLAEVKNLFSQNIGKKPSLKSLFLKAQPYTNLKITVGCNIRNISKLMKPKQYGLPQPALK